VNTNLTTKLKNTDTETFVTFALSFENTGRRGPGQFKAEPLDGVIPAWSAGIQADMDVPGRIRANLDAGYPCRHDEDLYFHVLRASVS
jgi:hypothetical protein